MAFSEEEGSLEEEIDIIYENIEVIANCLYPEVLEDFETRTDKVEDKIQASIGISGGIARKAGDEVDEVNLERRSEKFHRYYEAGQKGSIEEEIFRKGHLMDMLTTYGNLPEATIDPEPYQCTIAITYDTEERYQKFIDFLEEVLEELES